MSVYRSVTLRLETEVTELKRKLEEAVDQKLKAEEEKQEAQDQVNKKTPDYEAWFYYCGVGRNVNLNIQYIQFIYSNFTRKLRILNSKLLFCVYFKYIYRHIHY